MTRTHAEALDLIRQTEAVTAISHAQIIAIYLRATGALADGAQRLSDPVPDNWSLPPATTRGRYEPGTIATRLVALRKARKKTQNDVAKVVNRVRSAIAQWETGVTRPKHEELTKLAKLFNVSIDYLIDGRLD
jgi:DNA-binding XRE family transcriptional regulator